MERGRKINITGVWESWFQHSQVTLRSWRLQYRKLTADVVETAKEPELELEPEDVTELQKIGKT